MPKPLFGDNGSGMHTHQSLWKDGTNLFYDAEGYALLSETARHYIGGLLKHAKSILAFAAPTTNSYRRLVPGYEAPINLVYSQRNRSACVRIPTYFTTPGARRLEFRSPDPTCNPYLSFSAQLMAGLDGVINRIEPPAPVDRDIYEMSPEEKVDIAGTPGSLEEALDALEADHEYLLRGDVFTPDVIDDPPRVQAGRREGGRAAAAPVRVLPLLRDVIAPRRSRRHDHQTSPGRASHSGRAPSCKGDRPSGQTRIPQRRSRPPRTAASASSSSSSPTSSAYVKAVTIPIHQLEGSVKHGTWFDGSRSRASPGSPRATST